MDNRLDQRGGTPDPGDNARRAALKSLVAGTTTASVVVLGGQWTAPRVTSVVLPAHAMTTTATTDAFNGLYLIEPAFADGDFEQEDAGDCDGDDLPDILSAINGQVVPLTINGSQASVVVSEDPIVVSLTGPGSVSPDGQFSFVLSGTMSLGGDLCESVTVALSGVIGAPGGPIQGTISNVTTSCDGCVTSGSGTFSGMGEPG